MPNVLMIGGTGIISSEVCAHAVEKGYQVTILNRGFRADFICPEVELLVADVRNSTPEALQEKTGGRHFDVVVDFITYTPEHVRKMLEFVHGHTEQYIFISSATVYADSNGVRYTENSPIGNPRWKYAMNKADCETYLNAHAREYGIPYTIIRPYVTYGKTRFPFQIAPIEYYTIINRMLRGKPIPLYRRGTRCTLTTAAEFAVGAVGLFLNKKAIYQAFHITGECEMTWEEVLTVVAKKIGAEIRVVEIPEEMLRETKLCEGIDVDEILGDKGRSMIFDHTKISGIVPDFLGSTCFDAAIEDTIAYFIDHPKARKNNYVWDGAIDRLISYIPGLEKDFKQRLRYSRYDCQDGVMSALMYFQGRYPLVRRIIGLLHKW
jgi:nucleoside-diphosphate-sugar epimerase